MAHLKLFILLLISKLSPRLASRIMISFILSQARRRPHPLSMVHDYTSWTSLTDKKWSARHLPPRKAANLPPIEKILPIFQRSTTGPRFCEKSTCLFPAFAQYLTDGFVRTRMPVGDEPKDLRKQTTSNNEIDMCPLYGRLPEQTRALRLLSEKRGEKGRLKSQILETDRGREEYPPFLMDDSGKIKEEFALLDPPLGLHKQTNPDLLKLIFAVGGDRVNAVPTVSLLNTLFLREHNRLAGILEENNQGWDDERVFQTARNIVIVVFIKLVVEEYINHIRPEPARFITDPSIAWKASWNKPNWITTEFSLLYRWHSLIPDEMEWNGVKYPVQQTFLNNSLIISGGLAQGFFDLSSQKAGRLGVLNTNQWILPQEYFAIDQGRLCELASYSDYRAYVGLPRPRSFEDITTNTEALQILKANYKTVDDVEFYVGLFAEDTLPNTPLQNLMIRFVAIDAFSQALTNPLLSEHVFNEKTFTHEGWKIIQETACLADIVQRNANIPKNSPAITMTQPGWKFQWF